MTEIGRLHRYECLLLILGFGTSIALVLRTGWLDRVTIRSLSVTVIFLITYWILRNLKGDRVQKVRFLSGYFFVLWYYLSAGSFVVALQLPVRDAQLLAMDEAMCGVTPATGFQSVQAYWLTELMSGCYLSYLAYLHVAILHVIFVAVDKVQRFANWVLSVFAIGLPGYLLVPALGPVFAFPELFETPLVGGPITSLNNWVVQHGSTRYDAFPSLHVLITAALLVFDYRQCRRRFVFMAAPSLGIFVSTIYLRYHYLVDLLASIVLLFFALIFFRHRETSHVLPKR